MPRKRVPTCGKLSDFSVTSSPKHIELTTSGLSAAVAPHGAQLMSLKTAEGQELLWQGDPRYWADRAPILFPLIGPVVGGQIHHGRHSYLMPPHGFARGRNFAVSQQTPTSCLLELRDDRETRSHYPFAFTLRVGFELSDDSLHCTISVENPNEESLPADVGFHPGFNWPLTPGQVKEDFALSSAEAERLPFRRGAKTPYCSCRRVGGLRSREEFCVCATTCSRRTLSSSTGRTAVRSPMARPAGSACAWISPTAPTWPSGAGPALPTFVSSPGKATRAR